MPGSREGARSSNGCEEVKARIPPFGEWLSENRRRNSRVPGAIMFSASSAKCVGEIDPESPRSDVNLLKVAHNRPIREWL
jgi:hypothetical protein